MGSLRGCPGAALAPLLLLGFPALCLAGEALAGSGTALGGGTPPPAALMCSGAPAGLRDPGPTIDGQPLASCTLREKERRAFICRAPQAAPGSVLTWYLDGRRQEANCSAAGTASSTLTITARRTDRELNCSVTDPASSDTANASVLLDVQCKACGTGPAGTPDWRHRECAQGCCLAGARAGHGSVTAVAGEHLASAVQQQLSAPSAF